MFIDSVAGFVATSLGASYSTAKLGLRGFAMALSGEIRSRGLDVTIMYPFFTRTAILKSPVFGNAKVPPMPRIFISDPDKVMCTALRGVDSRQLHVCPGFYSKFMWQALRFWPVAFVFSGVVSGLLLMLVRFACHFYGEGCNDWYDEKILRDG